MFKKLDEETFGNVTNIIYAVGFTADDSVSLLDGWLNDAWTAWIPSKRCWNKVKYAFELNAGFNCVSEKDLFAIVNEVFNEIAPLIANYTHVELGSGDATKSNYMIFLRNLLTYIVLVGNLVY